MLRNVFLKTLRDLRRGLVWWIVGTGLYAAFMMAFWPTISAAAVDLEVIIDMWPEALRAAFIGQVTDLTSPAGFLMGYLFAMIVPLVFVAYAVGVGSSAIAGEEERGTLDLLLANPVSRGAVLLHKFAALVVGTTVLGLAHYLVLAVGALAVSMDISLVRLAEMHVSVVLLAVAFGALALALGAGRGSRGLATGASWALLLGGYLLNSMATVVDGLEPYRVLSPFYYYVGADPLEHGLDPAHVAVLLGAAAVLVVLAVLGFRRRDLSV